MNCSENLYGFDRLTMMLGPSLTTGNGWNKSQTTSHSNPRRSTVTRSLAPLCSTLIHVPWCCHRIFIVCADPSSRGADVLRAGRLTTQVEGEEQQQKCGNNETLKHCDPKLKKGEAVIDP